MSVLDFAQLNRSIDQISTITRVHYFVSTLNIHFYIRDFVNFSKGANCSLNRMVTSKKVGSR